MRRAIIVFAASTMLTMAAPAIAQETAAFRVELGGDSAETGVPATYAWLEQIGACSTTCGTGSRTTTYQCQNVANFDYSGGGYGAPEDEAYCSAVAGAKPADATSSCTVYSGCTYDWVTPSIEQTPLPLGGNPVGRVGCGYVNETFSPYCQRAGGNTNVVLGAEDHAFCSGDRPDYDPVAAGDPDALGFDRNVSQTGSCTTSDHDWNRGEWGPWSSTCSATAVRTRSVSCTRRFDGTTQADANCDQSQDHEASQTRAVYSGCSYERGSTVTDTGPWASGCSSDTSRTLTYNCRRSDGTDVAADECTSRGVSLTQSESGSNYASCTYSWSPDDTTTGWGASSDTCSANASQTRSIVCRRDLDGEVSSDSNCTGTRPASTRTVEDFSGCSYSRGDTVTNTGPWANGCSTNTSRTITYNCRRSDGTDVSASECTSRGVDLTRTETGSNYASCSYAWNPNNSTSGWGPTSNKCSASATQTRSVTCRRSDGATVSDSNCTGNRPASSRQVADYSGCSYARGRQLTDRWSSTCSSNSTRTRTYACRRSDGTEVSNSECTNRNVSLTVTTTGSNYSSCTYAWNPNNSTSGWGPTSNKCTSSATQTRSVTCRRSDGATVSDSNCTGTRPASSRNVSDYSGCSYARGSNVTNYGPWASSCSSSTSRTLTYNCRRSDGRDVSASECTSRNVSLTRSQSGSNYSGCSYARGSTVTNYGPWASSCSSSTRRTLTYNCRRSDGRDVSASECTSRNISLTRSQTGSNYSGCSYARGSATGSSWSSGCSTNATRTTTYACRRSDGTNVSASNCTSRGVSLTKTSTGSNYSSCTYTLEVDRVTACSDSGRRTRYWKCRRNQTGQYVNEQTYCNHVRSRAENCTPPYPNPGGHLPGHVLGSYQFHTCSTQYDYGTQGTYGSINPQSCRSTVATYTRKCQGGGNQTSNPGCTLMPYINNPRGPSGYPCDIICR